jgi:hypothetical protein
MADGSGSSGDPGTLPGELDHAELADIARQLQGQVDHLVAVDERRRARIERLERDRETLRRRLEQADSRGILDHARRLRRRRASSPKAPANDQQVERGMTVPDGVGYIPELSLPTPKPARSWLRVATILDEFSAASFGPEFTSVPLSATNWREQLEGQEAVDLLLVESAFRGHDGSWAHRVARLGEPSDHLAAVVAWCRRRGIPTVFWNKEDPVNIGWFLATAALFDQVFTVDGDMIRRYRQAFGHDRVGVLPFAAQPAFHYPPEAGARPGSVAFAGSYYAQKHPERRTQMESLLDPAREHGLHIYDRMGTSADSRFAWPERFRPHIVGQLSYPQMLEAYRRYRVFINVNTVTDSPTMCARRIFELAACGTAVVSGPSRAVEELIPFGAIAVARDHEEAGHAYATLLADADQRETMAERARAWVLGEHTYGHRVATILEAVGLPDRGPTPRNMS